MFPTRETYREQDVYNAQLKGNQKPKGTFKKKSPNEPKGHEMLLRILKDMGKPIEVTTIRGVTCIGTIKAHDAYTISLTLAKNESGMSEEKVFYKHAIESFKPLNTH